MRSSFAIRYAFATVLAGSLLGGCSIPETDSDAEYHPDYLEFFLDPAVLAEGAASKVDFTVNGQLRYEDRIYDDKGFTGVTQMLPIRYATVQLVANNGQVIAQSFTDGNGNYSIAGSAEETKLRVLAATEGGGAWIDIGVSDNNRSAIAVAKMITPVAGSFSLDIDVPLTRAAGAFNILDVMVTGAEYYQTQTGSWPGPLEVRWRPGESPMVTSFCGGCSVPTMFVMGGADQNYDGIYTYGEGDTDEFDDDVLWHEFGHFLENEAGVLDSQGGAHYLQHTNQDLRLAWSEGWSNFISGAIKAWTVEQGRAISDVTGLSGVYVDTFDNSAQIYYNFRTVPTLSNGTELQYASNEGAVAKILWDIRDDTGFRDAAIWQSFDQHMPTATWVSTLETFWDGILSTTPMTSAEKTALLTHFQGRLVDYAPDGNEPDAQDASAVPVDDTLVRNLYPGDLNATEQDWWSFTGSAGMAYRIETFNLKNGLDTVIRVHGPDGSVRENDNHSYVDTNEFATRNLHDGCTLASRVDIASDESVDGVWWIEVGTPQNLPAAAGRYGSYQLSVQSAASPAVLDDLAAQCP